MKGRKKKIRIWLVILAGVVIAAGIILGSFAFISAQGKKSLIQKQKDSISQIQMTKKEELSVSEENVDWQQGWIAYEGEVYAYNEDIMTFLFMGIDKDHEVEEVKEGTDGGQADALFLLVVNPHDETLKVISINRNTMASVDLYNDAGEYLSTVEAQIAVQHGFGNGVEESCEYQVDAVRRLFYNLPIHGYCAVNMDAVIELTNLIGGVELTALEDVTSAIQDETLGDYVVNKGETVLLDGRKAYSYVRYRNIDAIGSADLRLERQKQFLEVFMYKTIEAVKKDISLPVKLYDAVMTHMVTDVSAQEVAYLAGKVVNYKFDSNQFYSLVGETVQGEEFEEFYVDEDALYRMILEVFYEPVE